jgi:ribosome modulation factor
MRSVTFSPIYEEGFRAWAEGIPMSHCPYANDSEWVLWMAGWKHNWFRNLRRDWRTR